MAPRLAMATAESGVVVPVGLQVKLLAKVATFDRNMTKRAAGSVRVLVSQRPGDAESARTASRLQRALRDAGSIVGMPVAVSVEDFAGAAALASRCRSGEISIVYVTPGLGGAMLDVAAALEGLSILSVAAVPEYVHDGTVLAFDLIEGKPKILVHLGRAKAQMVDFKASFLRLAKVVDA